MCFTQLDTARAGYEAWRQAQTPCPPAWDQLSPTHQYAWLQATAAILRAYATWLARVD